MIRLRKVLPIAFLRSPGVIQSDKPKWNVKLGFELVVRL